MKIQVPRPRITREQLAARLTALGVPPGAYALYGGTHHDVHGIDQLPLGKWVVYFSERGSRHTERVFDDEGDACAELFRRLVEDGDVRGDAELL